MALLLPLMPWRSDMSGVGLGEPEVHIVPRTPAPPTHVETLLYDHWKLHNEMEAVNILIHVVFIISLVFNFILLSLFVIFEGVRSVPSNHFIAALSISNVLISGHLLTFNVILDPILGPDPLCDFAVYGGLVFCACSNLSRCAIAIDRYIFISDPLRYYQRTQSTRRAFMICGMFVICIAMIVSPYMLVMRQASHEVTCLPAFPKIYVACVTFLLTAAPGLLLVIIYTRIFYWAFLQMQILRQEARNFLNKQDPLARRFSVASSVTSKQLRLYTGAAIFLTPNSPFSSNKHSVDLPTNPDMPDPNMHTNVHKIIHMLAGLKDSRRERAGSTMSTCVDKGRLHMGKGPNPAHQNANKNAAGTSSHDCSNPTHENTGKNAAGNCKEGLRPIYQNVNENAANAKNGTDPTHQNVNAKAVRPNPSTQTLKKNISKATAVDAPGLAEFSSKSDIADEDTNAQGRILIDSKETSEVLSSIPSSQIDPLLRGSAIDTVYWGTLGQPLSSMSVGGASGRGYVPVTPQGRWLESQLRKYDVDVVRESTSDASDVDMPHNLMCNLLKAEVKAAVMIMALMGSFLLCWMPFFVVEMVSVFQLGEVPPIERRMGIMLIVLNCALDPLTYALMNPPFRAVVSRSMGTMCRTYREHHSSHQPQRRMAFRIKLKDEAHLKRTGSSI